MRSILFLIIVAYLLGSNAYAQESSGRSDVLKPIGVSGFQSSISHWRNLRDETRFIQVVEGQATYKPTQVREIVDNILLFQRADGGWPKDYDMTAVLTSEQRAKVLATRSNEDSSYDNGNLHSQVEYLARAFSQSNDSGWRKACERGFDFILASQYSNGGFPQQFPRAKTFHAHITFNDGAMIGILKVLRQAAEEDAHFRWLDPERRQRASLAVRKGIECMLNCQIRVNGELTGWCQQHDSVTFEARPARTFELASICPQETTDIVRYLMHLSEPGDNVLRSTDAAVAWLEKVHLEGIRIDKVAAPQETFLRHTANFDIVVIADSNANPIWARHYEIETNRPIFAGRDGIKTYSLSEIERERRTGSQWYGGWPTSLLKDYPEWRKVHGSN